LLCNNAVDVIASEERNVAAAMAVVNAEEGELGSVLFGGLRVILEQVEFRRVCILHAYAPALHGRQAVKEPFISAIRRCLDRSTLSVSSHFDPRMI
jgi:hypothetical protein